MSLLLVAPDHDMKSWENALNTIDDNLNIEIWPNVENKERVQFAVCWNQPNHVLDSYPNLRAVSSLGAGVDHLLSDDSLPVGVDICRVVSSSLTEQMKQYVLGAVLSIQRNFVDYIRQSDEGNWKPLTHRLSNEVDIGIMGLGKLGQPVARLLADLGFNVSGWSQSAKDLKNISTYAGDGELEEFLNHTQLLVCLLPLTHHTRGILNLDTFKALDGPSWVINTGRGEHLVDEDLIYALDSDILQGAWLDVFAEEPLPEKHAFWNRPNIIVTPHIASITRPSKSAEQIVENYKRALSGMKLNNAVDRKRGY